MIQRLAVFAILAGMLALAWPVLAQTDADLGALREFKVESSAGALMEYIKKRTPAPETIAKVDVFITQLGDEEHNVRETATKGLIELGPIARGRLTEALKSTDAEVKRRAKWALDRISVPGDDGRILPAVARVLATRKPAEGADVLLKLLPHIEREDVADEVSRALVGLGIGKDGKPTESVIKALGSPSKVQRAAAGMALALGPAGNRAMSYKLLEDPAPSVRRRVALALADVRDAKALPTLVALVGVDSEEDSGAAEDMLFAIAGEKSPASPPSGVVNPREFSRKAWETWLKTDGAKLDLTKVEMDAPGSQLTLIGTMEIRAAVGKVGRQTTVSALDNSGATRWKLELGSHYQLHASMSRRDRILVSEMNFGRIQEYDLKGKVHWTYAATNPLAAYRLRNGNTFIATRNSLILLDRDRRLVRTITRPGYDVTSATMFEDGRMCMITTSGQLIRYDKDGKEISSVMTGKSMNIYSRAVFHPDGSFVAPDYSSARVRSYDKDGKQLWESTVTTMPTFVVQLPGGNYLVGSRNSNQQVELDRNGKEVRRRTTAGTQLLFLERR